MAEIQVSLDEHAIRFTPDGKIAVMDAIRALSEKSDAGHIWRDLSQNNPEIITLCDHYKFQKKSQSTPVACGQTWEKIQVLLFDYLVEESIAAFEERN
jgi:hypothetical protein